MTIFVLEKNGDLNIYSSILKQRELWNLQTLKVANISALSMNWDMCSQLARSAQRGIVL